MYESVRLKQNSHFPDKNIYVKYQEWDVPYASMIHAHDFYELEFVIEGNGFELINGKHFEKKKGHGYHFNPRRLPFF